MSLENFKLFVRDNPSLINYVKSKEMTWQGFYELFSLYGKDNHIWDRYLGITSNGVSSFKDIFSMLNRLDMNELQKGIGTLQKGISYVQDIISNRDKATEEPKKDVYEPRPLYKYFDD